MSVKIAEYKFDKSMYDTNTDSNIYQIPEPITFNNSGFMDTEIQLLKNNSNWTIFLDCIPNRDNIPQAVIHCVDEYGSYPGISLSFENGYINLWDGTKGTRIGNGNYLNKNIKIVIVKKDNNIIIHHNNDPIYQINSPTTIPYTFKSVNSTLSIGGGHREEISLHSFTGVINNFIIYNKALEGQECNFIINNNGLLPDNIGLLPEFNAEFTNYEIVDEYLDTEDITITSTETIMIMDYNAQPDEYGVLTTEHELESINTISASNIVTRSIYSDELPTMMKFGTSAWNEHTDRSNSLLEILYLNSNELNNVINMFNNCKNLCRINASNLITNKINNIQLLFHECINLTVLDASNWDTSNVINTWGAFQGCSNLTTLNVSNWNTGNVKEFGYMFSGCYSLTSLDTSNWNTNEAQSMQYMFSGCKLLTSLDVSNWNTGNVNNMKSMFQNCNKLTTLDVSEWNVSKVGNMHDMFAGCTLLTNLDVSNWDTSGVTNMIGIFNSCSSLITINVSNWDTGNANNMSYMFANCTSLTDLDVSGFDTKKYYLWHLCLEIVIN